MPRTPEQFKELREKTRNKILDSALKLFATKGYHGTSINDIAKDAGISKGLAYNYFDSKKAIVTAILKKLLEIGEELDKKVDWRGDPYEALKTMISEVFRFIEQNEDFWRMYFAFSLQPAILEESKTVSGEFIQLYFKHIEMIFKKIGLPNPKAEAKVLGAILDGVGFHYFYIDNYSIRSMKQHLVKKYSKESLQKLIPGD